MNSTLPASFPTPADLYSNRRQRLIEKMVTGGLGDAALVTSVANVRYLTGFTGDSSYLLLTPDHAVILSDGRYQVQLANECPGVPVAIRPPSQKMNDLVQEIIGTTMPERLILEADQVTFSQFHSLEKTLSSTSLVPLDNFVTPLREIKDAYEISITRRAVEIGEAAFLEVIPTLTPQTTEREIAWKLEAAMRTRGAEGVSFEIIAAAGETGALPHYRPADREIGDEATLLIDWGAKFLGYASDHTRTLHREHASDRFRDCYRAVLEAQLAAIDALRPGIKGSEVDSVARKILVKHGLGDAFSHSLGHGIGLHIHEGPRLAAVAEDVLAEGMIVTVEPGVYFQADFGIRIEDDVLITPNGCEVLGKLPKGLDDCRLML
ncbi:putative peptidase [Rubripirellula amarantea]|uniref:Putative peptidase n=1 Tax=Rubripirellula amarantea TaxID=2527999 RepID=A0A5C5WBW7_9BACT|nr:Xaa-Pro peptidase family protein [Rubripirellula amarantea]TWT48150.1 putative peptidase [Rubripirellula amarantea]